MWIARTRSAKGEGDKRLKDSVVPKRRIRRQVNGKLCVEKKPDDKKKHKRIRVINARGRVACGLVERHREKKAI